MEKKVFYWHVSDGNAKVFGQDAKWSFVGASASLTEAASVWRSNGFTEFPLIKGTVKHEGSRFRTISTLDGTDKATRRHLA